MPASGIARAAAVVLIAEGLVIAAFAFFEMTALIRGEAASVPTALALIVLTLVGAGAMVAFAVAVVRDQSWGRSGGIVTQLLGLGVVFSALSMDPRPVDLMLAIAIPAVVGLVLLTLCVRQSGKRARQAEADHEANNDDPTAAP